MWNGKSPPPTLIQNDSSVAPLSTMNDGLSMSGVNVVRMRTLFQKGIYLPSNWYGAVE